MRLVVDASAAAAVVFLERDAWRVLVPLLEAKTLFVPTLFPLELANLGRNKVRRGELSRTRAARLLGLLRRSPLRVFDVPWEQAWAIAHARDLTLYDAAYLALAQRERAQLLTLDVDLAKAAGQRTVHFL